MSKKKTNKKKNRKKRNRSEEQAKRRPNISERSRFLEELTSGMAFKLLNRPSLRFYNPKLNTPLDEEDIEPPMTLYLDVDLEPESKNLILYDPVNDAVRVLSILNEGEEIRSLIKKLQEKALRSVKDFSSLLPEIKDSPVVVDIIVENRTFPTMGFSVYKDLQDTYQWVGPNEEPPVLGEMVFPIVRVTSADSDFLAERDLNRLVDNMIYLSKDIKAK